MDENGKITGARRFIESIPHARALNMTLDDLAEGMAAVSMPYDARLVGDPQTGVIHGGAVSALMDTCCGAAVMSHPGSAAGTATLDLRIDYMRAATPGQRLRASATCHHITRSVAFVRASAHDDNDDLPVATATGAFTVDTEGGGPA
ncbi:MAG: PaaI family thioesterase [Defluviimonas sp.]|nr:PaaI family thioesterase [Defluviimonas sp.]